LKQPRSPVLRVEEIQKTSLLLMKDVESLRDENIEIKNILSNIIDILEKHMNWQDIEIVKSRFEKEKTKQDNIWKINHIGYEQQKLQESFKGLVNFVNGKPTPSKKYKYEEYKADDELE